MGRVAVFDWAQVKLAEEWMSFLLTTEAPKQDIVSELANVGSVNVIWEDNGSVKLEGPWEHILKSQTVIENFFKSLESSASSSLGIKTALLSQQTQQKQDLVPVSNLVGEENEVYVSITLSNNPLSEFHPEVIQRQDSVIRNNSEESAVPIVNGNDFQESFVTEHKSITYKVEKESNLKECSYNTLEYQHELLYDICSTPSSDNSVSKSFDIKKLSAEHTGFKEVESKIKKQNTHNSMAETHLERGRSLVQECSCRNEVSGYHTTKCHLKNTSFESNKISDSVSSISEENRILQLKPKYLKKKDYEKLAPFKFFCSVCSFKSKRESHFQRHMKLHNEDSELFKCSQCNFTTIRLSHLRRHELNHSSLTLECSICHYQTNSPKLLTRHRRIKHSATKVNETKKEILYCVHCEYQTSRYHFLQRHMRVHNTDTSSIQLYQCEQCSYRTNRKEHFVRHTNNIHKGQRPFLCHRCGKAFKRQDALKQHASIHAAQASVSCPECGKGCRSRAHLSQHMSVHSSDRSFLCELCGASFKTRAVQCKHMCTVHQHPKAFFCNHCSRKFSTKFALRRHIKQHSAVAVEKATKNLEQETPPSVFVSDGTNSMKLVAMDTIFFSHPSRQQDHEQNVALPEVPSTHSEKITLQLTEAYESEAVRVIPAQSVVQNSESTALVYLTGTFTPL